MTKVLIVTHDLIGERMAGPAIRCMELARQLAGRFDVTVASLMPLDGQVKADFKVVSFENRAELLRPLAQAADVLLLQGLMHRRYPLLLGLGKYIVMDLYDPFIFESYPHLLEEPDGGRAGYLDFWDVMNEQMEVADFSLCASERQRDMWLGRYCGLGRLTPQVFAQDPSFRKLLDVVPFGLSDTPPRHERPVLKGVVPGIGKDDKVLLWGGGIWNWFDPLTVIRAVARLSESRSDIKLYFLGVKHPNPEIPEMAMASRAVQLAEDLGVKDRFVFFNHGWVPYAERQNYLLESDVGISAHFDSIETRFSFRTRVLDYLWAGLPIISTEGDAMAELTAAQGLGGVVRFGSEADWMEAITRLLDDADLRSETRRNVERVAEGMRWSRIADPLIRYCEAPYHLPAPYWSVTKGFGSGDRLPTVLRLALKTVRTLRTGGWSVFIEKGARYLKQRIGTPSAL